MKLKFCAETLDTNTNFSAVNDKLISISDALKKNHTIRLKQSIPISSILHSKYQSCFKQPSRLFRLLTLPTPLISSFPFPASDASHTYARSPQHLPLQGRCLSHFPNISYTPAVMTRNTHEPSLVLLQQPPALSASSPTRHLLPSPFSIQLSTYLNPSPKPEHSPSPRFISIQPTYLRPIHRHPENQIPLGQR